MVILMPSKIIEKLDHENIDIVTNNSPIRLMDGGRARFVKLARSHQAVIRGRIVCKPRAKIIVRL